MWQSAGKGAQNARRGILRLGATTVWVGWMGLSAAVNAQSAWPVQALRLVVGFPAGSSPDLTARTLAEPLAQALGQPVMVDNKPGAGGNIGAAAVAQARDGHTLGLMINGNLTTAKLLNPATPYDPHQDLAPVSLIATAPLVLTAAAQLPAQGPALLSAGQQAGQRWNYGSPGVGTVAHLGMELLKARTGWAAVHVPYPGNPQVVNALLAGQIQLALLPPGLAMPQTKAGKLHAIGLTSVGRSVLAPDVPSLAEAGFDRRPDFSGFQLEIWNAVAVPNTMPVAHVQRLATTLTDIVRRPEIRQKLFQQGWQVVGTAPEGLALRIKADTIQMNKVIQTQGIAPQ